jgi:hypothetical protein
VLEAFQELGTRVVASRKRRSVRDSAGSRSVSPSTRSRVRPRCKGGSDRLFYGLTYAADRAAVLIKVGKADLAIYQVEEFLEIPSW